MTRVKGTISVLTLITLLLFSIQSVWAQTEDEKNAWKIKGFTDTYHAVRSQQPMDIMSSRTRLRGEISKTSGNASLFISFNATYNALLKERTGLELREAYIDYRSDKWGFRAGKQLIIWGVADGLRITDLVSPMDMTEFLAQDYDDIRLPVNALRFFLSNSFMKLELVAVPIFTEYILPTSRDNPWCVLPKDSPLPLVWNGDKYKPQTQLKNSEWGGRLSFTLPGIDFSLAGLYTWNKLPLVTYEMEPTHINVNPRYYRMAFIGGDVSKPLGQFVLRGEAAVNIGKHLGYKKEYSQEPHKGFNTISWLLGIDWYAPREWTLMAQFSSEKIGKYESILAQPQNTYLMTLNISKLLLESTLKLSNFTYYDLNENGWLSRFSIDYSLNDHIKLSTGYDWLGGSKGIFGMYKDNSELWVKAKYNF